MLRPDFFANVAHSQIVDWSERGESVLSYNRKNG